MSKWKATLDARIDATVKANLIRDAEAEVVKAADAWATVDAAERCEGYQHFVSSTVLFDAVQELRDARKAAKQ